MGTKIKAGYCEVGSTQFKNGQWFINSAPVAQQIQLSQYPCYALSDSELGSYVCVIGDINYKYCNDAFKKASGMKYTYLEENPALLNSLWLLEYDDAFYIAVNGTFGARSISEVIPVAFNAYDMSLHFRELHVYLDVETDQEAGTETVLGTIVLFDNSVQNSFVHFYLNRADCEDACSLYVNTVLSKGILTSLKPNITGFDANMNIDFIEEMGTVDIHIVDKAPDASVIIDACAQACDGFAEQSKRISSKNYIPVFNTPPIRTSTQIIPTDIKRWASLLTVTSPSVKSLAFIIERYYSEIVDEDSEFEDTFEDLLDDLKDHYHMIISLLAASQVCGYTAQDYSIEQFERWFEESDDINTSKHSFLDCMKHDFLFPDAVAFYANSGIMLRGDDYDNIEAILSGNYALALYDKIAETFISPFSKEYAKLMQTRRYCFKEGKSGRATLPTKVPFAEGDFGRDVALLYYAYAGILGRSEVSAVDKYLIWDLLCSGPFFVALLMKGCTRTKTRRDTPDHVSIAFRLADNYMEALYRARSTKTKRATWDNKYLEVAGCITDNAGRERLKTIETTYNFTTIKVFSNGSPVYRFSTSLEQLTMCQFYLLGIDMPLLADAIPRNLNNSFLECNRETLRVVTYVVHLWLRAVLGSLDEAKDPVCNYRPFQRLSKQEARDWLVGIDSWLDDIQAMRKYTYGWATETGFSKYFCMTDIRGKSRLFKGFTDVSKPLGESSARGDYPLIKQLMRAALVNGLRKEGTYDVNAATQLGIFSDTSISDSIYFTPACYEISSSFMTPDDYDNFVSEESDELCYVPYLAYTAGILEYTQRTVHALLVLSDKNNPDSFYNLYTSALRAFSEFFKPLFMEDVNDTFVTKMLLTTSLIQHRLPEYTLDALLEVLSTLNPDTAWREALNEISPGGNTIIENICSPKRSTSTELVSSSIQNKDLAGLLDALDSISLDESAFVEDTSIQNPVLRVLTSGGANLLELQPRNKLIEQIEAQSAITEDKTGLDILEEEASQTNADIFSALDDFLSNKDVGSELEENAASLDKTSDSLENSAVADSDNNDTLVSDAGSDTEDEANELRGFETGGLAALEALEGITDKPESQPEFNTLENPDALLEPDVAFIDTKPPVSLSQNDFDTISKLSDGLENESQLQLDELQNQDSNNLTENTEIRNEPFDENTEGIAPTGMTAVDIFAQALSSGKSIEDKLEDAPIEGEYLYNFADPQATESLVTQIDAKHPSLAFKLLAIISEDESAPSMLVEPTFKSLIQLCQEKQGICYLDKENTLRVYISGFSYLVLQVNNAERRTKNALTEGMLNYKYYGKVLPRITGDMILF